MKKILIVCLLVVVYCLSGEEIAKSDSLVKREFVWAASEVVGLNLGVWSVDHYIAQKEWANISWRSVEHNLKSGFVFDDSEFLMNQFLHPYHGNLYYNSARSNGYNFWESAPFALTGSFMWEMFMEIEEPSNNDLITTTMGGIMLGEITWRVSSLILDDNASGSERFWRELSAGLVNPVRGFNRLLNGQTKGKTHRKNQEWQPVMGEISLGGNTVGKDLDLNNGEETPLLKVQFIYGSPFIKEEREPFDYFNLHLGINLSKENTISNFYGDALLYGRNFNFLDNSEEIKQDNLGGIFQHFDYLANEVYKISASGVGGGIISRYPAYDGMELMTSVHGSLVFLGGSNSSYALESGRDYNLGSGYSSKFEGWLVNEKYGEMYVSYLRYWIYTLSGADGSEEISITNGRIETPLGGRFKLGIEYLYYYRQGIYEEYADITKENNELRTYISYRF